MRGGSWVTHDVSQLRCAHRHKVPTDTYAYSIGFRVVYTERRLRPARSPCRSELRGSRDSPASFSCPASLRSHWLLRRSRAQTPSQPSEPVVVVSGEGLVKAAPDQAWVTHWRREPVAQPERSAGTECQCDERGAAETGRRRHRQGRLRTLVRRLCSSSPTGSTAVRCRAAMSRATRSRCGSTTSRGLARSSTSR